MMEHELWEKFHTAVAGFKDYQKTIYPHITEENDNGEWVFGGEFDELCRAYLNVVQGVPCGSATDEQLDDLLYTIARDSECSHLLIQTLHYSEWFAALCRQSLKTNYVNAVWQFAEQLPKYNGAEKIQDFVFVFIEYGDEYTERMALHSMAEICPERAEEYAIKFWNRNKYVADEYQKIMALYTLNRVKSPALETYLLEAEKSEYMYLRDYAEKLRGLV